MSEASKDNDITIKIMKKECEYIVLSNVNNYFKKLQTTQYTSKCIWNIREMSFLDVDAVWLVKNSCKNTFLVF